MDTVGLPNTVKSTVSFESFNIGGNISLDSSSGLRSGGLSILNKVK